MPPERIEAGGQTSALADERGANAVDRDRADYAHEKQHAQEHPSVPPKYRPGGDEEQDRDESRVGDESDYDSEHRQRGSLCIRNDRRDVEQRTRLASASPTAPPRWLCPSNTKVELPVPKRYIRLPYLARGVGLVRRTS